MCFALRTRLSLTLSCSVVYAASELSLGKLLFNSFFASEKPLVSSMTDVTSCRCRDPLAQGSSQLLPTRSTFSIHARADEQHDGTVGRDGGLVDLVRVDLWCMTWFTRCIRYEIE
ncbi:hypothetical protein C8F01DRAFT_1134498 [Mycena amicta]|nr:hypothetical protein C8F01DRAFT_1134498 [Mycena amicta]